MRRPDHDRRKLVTAVRTVKHGLRNLRHRGSRITDVHHCLTAIWRQGLIGANAALQNGAQARRQSVSFPEFLGASRISGGHFRRGRDESPGRTPPAQARGLRDEPGHKEFHFVISSHSINDAAVDQANPEASCHSQSALRNTEQAEENQQRRAARGPRSVRLSPPQHAPSPRLPHAPWRKPPRRLANGNIPRAFRSKRCLSQTVPTSRRGLA